jgi:SAM-dependent methyltransferase
MLFGSKDPSDMQINGANCTLLPGTPFTPLTVIKGRVKTIAKRWMRDFVPYDVSRRIGLFKHGLNDDHSEAARKFLQHRRWAQTAGLVSGGWHGIEIGPGDSLATGLCALLVGAQRVSSIDVGPFATKDRGVYQRVIEHMRSIGQLTATVSVEDLVERYVPELFANYHCDGIHSLAALATGSVDFIFSSVAVEHIDENDLRLFVRESWRVLKPGGVCSHGIDFRDHVTGGLVHLIDGSVRQPLGIGYINGKGPRYFWEKFCEQGFECQIVHAAAWKVTAVNARFCEHIYGDSLVAEMDFIAHKPLSPQSAT